MVPAEFISYETGVANVLVKDVNNKYTSKEVKLGISEGKMTEVISGLIEGEIVALKMISKKKWVKLQKFYIQLRIKSL